MTATQQPSVTPFQREQRYIVIKRKELTEDQELRLNIWLNNEYVRRIGCVVIENDWPEYEPVWGMLERRVTGQSQQPSVTQADRDAAWNIVPYAFLHAMGITKEVWDSGVYDNNRHIQAFARHREASTAEMRAENERLLEAASAGVRAAKMALFVMQKRKVRPNASWESGINADIALAEAALPKGSAEGMSGDKSACMSCGKMHPFEALDGKPKSFARFWWRFMPTSIARRLLGRAASRGVDFDWVEGPCCYGPGYVHLVEGPSQ